MELKLNEGKKLSNVRKSGKSWASVLTSSKSAPVRPKFDFNPPPEGKALVDPPGDLLEEGMNKLRGVYSFDIL